MTARASGSRRMLFQSGSRTTSNWLKTPLSAAWSGLPDGRRHPLGELLEVLAEQLGEAAGLRVVRRRVAPGGARIEHRVGDAGNMLGHLEAEHRLAAGGHPVPLAGGGRPESGARG